jgi:hypothetical protein
MGAGMSGRTALRHGGCWRSIGGRHRCRRSSHRFLERLRAGYPDYHEALRLSIEGHSRTSIAELLAASGDSVRNRLHRGRQKLLAFIHEEIWAYSGSSQFEEEVEALSRLLPPEL